MQTSPEIHLLFFEEPSFQNFSVSRLSTAAIFATLSLIVIFFCVRNKRKVSPSLSFLCLTMQWWMGFIYGIISLIFTLSLAFFPKFTSVSCSIFVTALGFLAISFSVKEISYFHNDFEFLTKRFKTPSEISISTLISLIFSFSLILLWRISGNYILSNILACFLVFASFKVFRIRNLRSGTYFLLIVGCFEILQEILMVFWLERRVHSAELNLPLLFHIPNYENLLNKTNSNVINLIFPGMLLSYFHRYDQNKHIRIYFLMGYFSYFCGTILWILISFFLPNPLSFFIYPLPFMIGFSSILGYKRNENLDLWEGLFYDYDQSVGNIREEFIVNETAFKKKILFEGLLDSSFESTEEEEIDIKKIGEGSDIVLKSNKKCLEESKSKKETKEEKNKSIKEKQY